jgi:hypothetical protein
MICYNTNTLPSSDLERVANECCSWMRLSLRLLGDRPHWQQVLDAALRNLPR